MIQNFVKMLCLTILNRFPWHVIPVGNRNVFFPNSKRINTAFYYCIRHQWFVVNHDSIVCICWQTMEKKKKLEEIERTKEMNAASQKAFLTAVSRNKTSQPKHDRNGWAIVFSYVLLHSTLTYMLLHICHWFLTMIRDTGAAACGPGRFSPYP